MKHGKTFNKSRRLENKDVDDFDNLPFESDNLVERDIDEQRENGERCN
jgi:hypothetical protein